MRTYSDTTRRVLEAALEYLKPQLSPAAHAALTDLFKREAATPEAVVDALACRDEGDGHDH